MYCFRVCVPCHGIVFSMQCQLSFVCNVIELVCVVSGSVCNVIELVCVVSGSVCNVDELYVLFQGLYAMSMNCMCCFRVCMQCR